MTKPLVSTIIPVFNGARYLAQTIESVLAQTYPHIEIVAIDDGSTDDSPEILSRYRDRICLIQQTNQGVAAARNRGILAARGEYIAFLDQDDWWYPQKIERQVSALVTFEAGLAHTQTLYFDDVSQTFCPPLDSEARPEEYVGWCFEKLLFGNAICNSSVVVRRELFARAGLCDLVIEGNTVQDYDLWLRLAKITPFTFISEPLTVFRLHSQQGTVNRRMMLREQIKILYRRLPDAPTNLRRPVKQRLGRLYDLLGSFELDYRDHRAARRAFVQSFRCHPHFRALGLWLVTFLPAQGVAKLRELYTRWKGFKHGKNRNCSGK
ncbi:MAG: glycosyltransferase [Thermogutta sp.]